ncbi:MAG: alpha/beta fold hydrolase [Flavobacteriales bacterium]
MKNTAGFIFLFLTVMGLHAKVETKHVYLFPGQGSDERLFEKFKFDSTFLVHHVTYPIPEKKETLKQYALRIGQQIDTTKPFILIGVSIGGMICTELADVLHPEKIIIISSAKCRSELPGRYKFQKSIPLNKIVPKGMIKSGARFLQPMVEPDRNKNKKTFKSMLKSKNARYMKRSVNMIINWERTTYSPAIFHIHGTNDHTIPLRNVCADMEITHGSHMMTLTQGDKIFALINQQLKN